MGAPCLSCGLADQFGDVDRRMLRGQQHAMIQRVDDLLQGVAHGDEVDDVLILAERSVHLGGHMVVVPMKPLAHVVAVGDEVRGAEDKALLRDADVVGFGHLTLRS